MGFCAILSSSVAVAQNESFLDQFTTSADNIWNSAYLLLLWLVPTLSFSKRLQPYQSNNVSFQVRDVAIVFAARSSHSDSY